LIEGGPDEGEIMYLKRLEMNGFKSFVEAQLVFQPGVTAVVGPNGTGKSNVLDAVLWVLGEQSTKTLRSERMEDVIFNGTEARKPLGMVEVSLILGGVDGDAALPYSLGEYQEVMVTRRLFRDGVSEYFINKTPCRLKDIRGLLLDTRAGSKGHTIIEQGMIDRLLKASPVERRELIEETAGIIRYKKQKAEALRKLESTNQNLLRVRDIVTEVKRQLATLERQARAAEAHQALRREIHRLELQVLIHDYQAVLDEREGSDRVLGDLAVRESAGAAAVARLSAEVEALHLEVTEGEARIMGLRDEAARAEARLAQVASAIELLTQRAAFQDEQRIRVQADLGHVRGEQQTEGARLSESRACVEDLNREFSGRSGAAAEAEAALAEVLRRHRENQAALESARALVMDRVMAATVAAGRLESERARASELRRQGERIEREQVRADADLRSVTGALSACIDRRTKTEARLAEAQAARKDLTESVLRLKEGLSRADQQVGRLQEESAVAIARQRVLESVTRESSTPTPDQAPKGSGLLKETVAQVLSVPAEYERAIEAVLNHRLLGTLVEGPEEAMQWLGMIKEQGAAGGTFIPKQPRVFGVFSPVRLEGPGVVGLLQELVTARKGSERLVTHLLAGVVVVNTLEQAIGLWHGMTEAKQALLVTLNGEIVAPDGMVIGGPVGAMVGTLSRDRELKSLAVQVKELERARQAAQAQRETLTTSLAGDTARLESLEAGVRQLEMALLGERKDEQQNEQEFARCRQRIQLLLAEREGVEAELAALADANRAGLEELQRLEAERVAAEQSMLDRQDAASESEAVVEQQQAAVANARMEAAGLKERLEQIQAEVARRQASSALREARIHELEAEVTRLRTAHAEAVAERRQTEATVPGIQAEVGEISRRLTEAQEAQGIKVGKVRALEADWNRVRHVLEDIHRQQETVRMRRVEAQTRLEGYDAQLAGTYGVNYEAALSELGEGERPAIEVVRERLAQKRGRLQELGPVNVLAIDEHRELEERLRFLTTQEEDLTQSIASLKGIIARVNKTTKQLFLDTFQSLQIKFNEMFQGFFEGGRAELILVEDEETSEPGVDIVAQPPGKRLKNISMLSGGERALTAMALIFASFLIRPTPFCVLDEIDAPLDEENTVRFTRVLRELSRQSQFIVITHSKQTMEMADSLYGVTMEEAGVSSLVSVRLNRLLEHA
jgi:chromosome segregation protein